MSEQIQQKQSEMTTNYESAIEHDQTELQTLGVNEHLDLGHQSQILTSQQKPQSDIQNQYTNEAAMDKQQSPQANQNYQILQEDPSETAENIQIQHLSSHLQNDEPKQFQQHFQSQHQDFDQFNHVQYSNNHQPQSIDRKKSQSSQKLPEQIVTEAETKQIKGQKVSTVFQSDKNQILKEEVEQPIPIPIQKSVEINQKPAIEAIQKLQKPVKSVQNIQKPKEKQEKKDQISSPVTYKKKSKKKLQEKSEPLPVIAADSPEGKKQLASSGKKTEEKRIVRFQNNYNKPNKEVESKRQHKVQVEGQRSVEGQGKGQVGDQGEGEGPKIQQEKSMKQEMSSSRVSESKQNVSEVNPSSISTGLIIFEAQRQRIGTTLQYFQKYISKHDKHTKNQKQLISNVQEQILKKKLSKAPLCNTLRDYFQDFINMSKNLYQKSYKYTKSEKVMSANPMVNMKQELKVGIDELIFLRKNTGNQYNRLGQFVSGNIQKNLIKLFNDYWKAVDSALAKHKEKKDEFIRKEKDFIKRIAKVVKVYTKGKQGVSLDEDLFIEMTKFINQEKQYRTSLIDYGMSLVPLKKAFIKAEQVLYQELQVIFNTYKNQFRTLYSIHPKQFVKIQKLEEQVRQNNTFEKLSDITDGDYVRSVLQSLQKNSIEFLTDKDFEKVLNLLHFEEIIGHSIELLKGTTSKSFDLKNKAEQVIDTVSGNLLIFNKETAQMKEKFIIKNINAKIVQDGVVQIDQVLKGIIFDSNRTVRVTFRDNDRAEELICFLNQLHDNSSGTQSPNNKN